ncbi:class I SAM-dependent methyltransferase [Tengunoibacter tsumagoiensis]|nr:class I SAM-dependent methyltransferase [Tengunoibacter tsumagoiensis]
MTQISHQQYLLDKQYNTSKNLDARIRLHELFSTNPLNWQHWVFDQLELSPGSRILEIGSGSAQLWVHNLEHIPAGCEITLSDFSAGMLQAARANLGEHASQFQFAVIDVQSIPASDNTFDYVIANHMLYHVPDRAQALAEIRRVLRPQGRFYAATNGEAHLREMDLLRQQAGLDESGILGVATSSAFSLQNGAAQLAPWFSEIECRRFEGGLAVTEAEPLVAFILSIRAAESISEAQLAALRAIIDAELSAHGVIHITKESGLFIASGVR